jgi:long-chain acyl-CoA synthetase
MLTESYPNLPRLFEARVQKTPNSLFLSHKENGRWVDQTWKEGYEEVNEIARGLIALGLPPGGKVSILSFTNHRWILADLGILSAGGVTVPIYQSNTPQECQYILDNSEAELIFVENELQLKKVMQIREQIPRIRKVILMFGSPPNDPWVITFEGLKAEGSRIGREAVTSRINALSPKDLATLVYTSGTTGPPKGTMLTHGNFDAVTLSVQKVMDLNENDLCLLFLPLAHIFARIIEWGAIRTGYGIAVAESIDRLLDNLKEVRPTFMPSVPRIYEKVYSTITRQVNEAGGIKKKIFDWSLKVGREVSQHRQKNLPLPPLLNLKFKIAQKLVFSKLKKTFGGRIRYFISGGAPLSREIAEFFHAADLLILEGYGLTETTAVTNVNPPHRYKFGTVGPTIPGVEQKIAPDGEILSRGPGIMLGYFKREEDTREAIDSEGWFHTGDIGEFDSDGYLKITDRKKDIIVTAGGKNIAPQNIENLMKTLPMISQIVVYGDKRKYLTALITLEPEETARFAEAHKLLDPQEVQRLKESARILASTTASPEARAQAIETRNQLIGKLKDHPEVIRWVQNAIEEKNRTLASFETIKRFRILAHDFTIDSGELTPTLKVKRKLIYQRYKDLFDSMYDEKFD